MGSARQYAGEALLKAACVILTGRCTDSGAVASSAHVGGLTSTSQGSATIATPQSRSQAWFALELPLNLIQAVLPLLEPCRADPTQPLTLEIYCQAAGQEPAVLLERWQLEVVSTAGAYGVAPTTPTTSPGPNFLRAGQQSSGSSSGGSGGLGLGLGRMSTSDKATYKRLTMLMRALCAHLPVLPAQQLVRQIKRQSLCPWRLAYLIRYGASSPLAPAPCAPGRGTGPPGGPTPAQLAALSCQFAFAPALTPAGSVCIRVAHLPAAAMAHLQAQVALQPGVVRGRSGPLQHLTLIQDYLSPPLGISPSAAQPHHRGPQGVLGCSSSSLERQGQVQGLSTGKAVTATGSSPQAANPSAASQVGALLSRVVSSSLPSTAGLAQGLWGSLSQGLAAANTTLASAAAAAGAASRQSSGRPSTAAGTPSGSHQPVSAWAAFAGLSGAGREQGAQQQGHGHDGTVTARVQGVGPAAGAPAMTSSQVPQVAATLQDPQHQQQQQIRQSALQPGTVPSEPVPILWKEPGSGQQRAQWAASPPALSSGAMPPARGRRQVGAQPAGYVGSAPAAPRGMLGVALDARQHSMQQQVQQQQQAGSTAGVPQAAGQLKDQGNAKHPSDASNTAAGSSVPAGTLPAAAPYGSLPAGGPCAIVNRGVPAGGDAMALTLSCSPQLPFAFTPAARSSTDLTRYSHSRHLSSGVPAIPPCPSPPTWGPLASLGQPHGPPHPTAYTLPQLAVPWPEGVRPPLTAGAIDAPGLRTAWQGGHPLLVMLPLAQGGASGAARGAHGTAGGGPLLLSPAGAVQGCGAEPAAAEGAWLDALLLQQLWQGAHTTVTSQTSPQLVQGVPEQGAVAGALQGWGEEGCLPDLPFLLPEDHDGGLHTHWQAQGQDSAAGQLPTQSCSLMAGDTPMDSQWLSVLVQQAGNWARQDDQAAAYDLLQHLHQCQAHLHACCQPSQLQGSQYTGSAAVSRLCAVREHLEMAAAVM